MPGLRAHNALTSASCYWNPHSGCNTYVSGALKWKIKYFWGATLGTIEPGHVLCRVDVTRPHWGCLPWVSWMSPSLCYLAWAPGTMSCHRCCCGCREATSEDIENCPTSDARQHYSFSLHSEIRNSPEHQFCWARSELGFCGGHIGNHKVFEHPP